MAYTVKQVAAMSGVSVRTLHFYDEQGLLTPARRGPGEYRSYEQPHLLRLQQILFYRELGFPLKRIKQVLDRPGFRKTAALQAHRKTLQQNLARTRRLIDTIDKTTRHLKGTRKMTSEELFSGFTVAANADRFDQRTILGGAGGEPIDAKVSGRDTAGQWCAFEFTCRSGGPQHSHHDQDEWVYVIDGDFEFHVGRRTLHVGPGESVFVPRDVPHVWACTGAGGGKVINVYQPAGQMEAFFREIGKYDGKPAVHEALGVEGLRHLFDAHGMKLLGPPLGWKDPPLDPP
jgi:DNA-binding transcriptional MerR regulator/quercetin dioxygenase-like cupin family protein